MAARGRPAGLDFPGEMQGATTGALALVWVGVLCMCYLGTRSLRYAVYVTVAMPAPGATTPAVALL